MREKEEPRMMPCFWLAQWGGWWFITKIEASQFERGLDMLSLIGAVGRIMTAQRCPHPNSQNLWLCYFTWQMRFCRCKLRILRWIILDYLGESNAITRVLIRARQEGQSQGSYDHRSISWSFRVISQEMQAAIEDKKVRKWILPWILQKGHSPADTLISAHWDWFWASDL